MGEQAQKEVVPPLNVIISLLRSAETQPPSPMFKVTEVSASHVRPSGCPALKRRSLSLETNSRNNLRNSPQLQIGKRGGAGAPAAVIALPDNTPRPLLPLPRPLISPVPGGQNQRVLITSDAVPLLLSPRLPLPVSPPSPCRVAGPALM